MGLEKIGISSIIGHQLNRQDPFNHRSYHIPFEVQFKEVRKSKRKAYKDSLRYVFNCVKDIDFKFRTINKVGMVADAILEYYFIDHNGRPLQIIFSTNGLGEASLNHITFNKRGYKKFGWLMNKIFIEQFPKIYNGEFLQQQFEPNYYHAYINERIEVLKQQTGMTFLEYVRFCLGLDHPMNITVTAEFKGLDENIK